MLVLSDILILIPVEPKPERLCSAIMSKPCQLPECSRPLAADGMTKCFLLYKISLSAAAACRLYASLLAQRLLEYSRFWHFDGTLATLF